MAQDNIDPALMQLWEDYAAELFERNGKNARFPKGGQDVAGNPELAATLRELAPVYLSKCQYKFALLKEQREIDSKIVNGDEEGEAYDRLFTRTDEIKDLIKKFDLELLQVNAQSKRKLMQSPGFSKELNRREENEDKAGSLAVILLAPVIKYSVAAACEHSGYILNVRDDPRLLKAVEGVIPVGFAGETEPWNR